MHEADVRVDTHRLDDRCDRNILTLRNVAPPSLTTSVHGYGMMVRGISLLGALAVRLHALLAVGVNNHRQFLLFVSFLVISVVLFIRLAIGCKSRPACSTNILTEAVRIVDYTINAPVLPPDTFCILPSTLCTASHFDTFALGITFWASLQLTWTSILLVAQLWQIARQMTTLEVSNMGKHGFMGGRPSIANAQNGRANGTAPTASGGGADQHIHGEHCDHSSSSPSGSGSKSKSTHFLLKILGIDRFTSGRAAEGLLAKSTTVANPFDLGVRSNCTDFWTRGKELGVEYERLYSVPEGGFAKVVRERKRREKEGTTNVGNGGSSNSNTYERVEMEDV